MGSLPPQLDEQLSILYVDAFDSFTNNIIGLLEQYLGAQVTVVRIDDEVAQQNLRQRLSAVDAVVVGPGPGHPAEKRDVGLINRLWALEDEQLLPILGFCLGFQSLCLHHGAEVKRLRRARHGIISRASHRGSDIFAGIGELEATQYHSLHADIVGDANAVSWGPSRKCPSLWPLAWDVGDNVNGPILMAVRHIAKPFWGVQFHPESICTSEGGKDLISNWGAHSKQWLQCRGRRKIDALGSKLYSPRSPFRLTQPGSNFSVHEKGEKTKGHTRASNLAQELRAAAGLENVFLCWAEYPAAGISIDVLFETLGCRGDEVILLDSQGHASGRFTILGVVLPGQTMKIMYSSPDRSLRYGTSTSQMCTMRLNSVNDVWPVLQEALDHYAPCNQEYNRNAPATSPEYLGAGHLPTECPFWGGFMGYISYEAGLETIDVALHSSCTASGEAKPDINFAFVHRSIIIDHANSKVYVQSLLPGDCNWIHTVGGTIESVASQAEPETPSTPASAVDLNMEDLLGQAVVVRPDEETYRAKVRRCQDFLASGDSYELCLTEETKICLPRAIDPWALYRKLRLRNPASFGAFISLSGVTVVGSSPERFLQWTREGHCQFRPIKGTVKKHEPDMTRERAHAILGSSKERAENLMIVDLIRHDLSGVVGAENTCVSQLMVVEEYETVYQLVSVIEGQLPQDGPRGIDVLTSPLPPGSMTGAPKKRSCEILRDLEQRPRGVYSGVLGYMDVGGAGDFSVVIRTAVRAEGDATNVKPRETHAETWRVGAGGAVTIQSTDEAEFHEMETKASSVLGALLGQN